MCVWEDNDFLHNAYNPELLIFMQRQNVSYYGIVQAYDQAGDL
jgi:hypothetical protein